jgi:hypothetical protein
VFFLLLSGHSFVLCQCEGIVLSSLDLDFNSNTDHFKALGKGHFTFHSSLSGLRRLYEPLYWVIWIFRRLHCGSSFELNAMKMDERRDPEAVFILAGQRANVVPQLSLADDTDETD